MTISRSDFHGRVAAVGLVALVAFSLTGCVSVKDSGTEVSRPPPPTATVAFHSFPNNAEVYVNGEFRGTAPMSLHLTAGAHEVVFRLEGYQAWERELVVAAGNDTRVAAILQPE
jgi:hypothetical protein